MTAIGNHGSGERIRRVLWITGAFILVSPLVGSLTHSLLAALMEMTSGRFESSRYVELVWFALLYGIPFGYLLLGGPAAAAGLMVGIWQAFVGRMSWWFAFLIGVVIGTAFQVAFGHLVSPGARIVSEQAFVAVTAFAIGAFVAWALIRKQYFAHAATGAPR